MSDPYGELSPLQRVVAEAIARARHYENLAAVDAVDDGEPQRVRQEAWAIAAAVQQDTDSGARLRAELSQFCDQAEQYQHTLCAWVPTSALRHLIGQCRNNTTSEETV